jgi:hypothetical protein
MCDEASRMIREEPWRREKVMRWLGFIQGAMWAGGYISIDTGKQVT